MRAIPKNVLKLLENEWSPPKGYSAFDSNFEGDRRHDPSYYVHRRGGEDNNGIRAEEAADLSKAGIFAGLAVQRDNGVFIVNEHAQHALTDFCSEVYEAWARFRTRINEVESQGVFPGGGDDL